VAIFVLTAISGFFVAGEFALVKVRKTRIEQLISEGNATARIAHKELEHLDLYIAATQAGITLSSVALGWLGGPSLAYLIESLFLWLHGTIALVVARTIAIILSLALIAGIQIIIGETIPRSIALQRSEDTILLIARPLDLFTHIFRPFIALTNSASNFIIGKLGLQATNEYKAVHSVEELEMLVSQSREAGLLQQQEELLLRHVFDFSDKTAQQIMVPRNETVGVPVSSTLEELADTFAREKYTRLPVYEESLDNIIGLVHIKDLFQEQIRQTKNNFSLRAILRPILYITEMTALDIVLAQMRTRRIHMAVVIDEYGTTAGIITMEDIIEEIVGEVQDEFDTCERGVRPEIEVHPDGTLSVDGLMSLSSFADQFGSDGVNLEEIHSNTLAGYIFEKLDRLPRIGDVVPFEKYLLKVEEMDGYRIARVRVEHKHPANEAESESRLTLVKDQPQTRTHEHHNSTSDH
jgi:CBS domain containing-hemolysin-like protein